MRSKSLVVLLFAASMYTNSAFGICESDNLEQDIQCLEEMGYQIDAFFTEYLRWAEDVRTKAKELAQEEADCLGLKIRYEQNVDLTLLKNIRNKCEGPWLADRTSRFNDVADQYVRLKAVYGEIKTYYDSAKDVLRIIEARQRRVEADYERAKSTRR